MHRMLRRLLPIIALVLLFGLGQQAATVHAISHLTDAQTRQDSGDQKGTHLSFCDKCVVYAALGSAVDSHALHIAVIAAPRSLFLDSSIRRFAAPSLHYAIRAPPSLA
jgi:hypothetical protein